MTVKSIIDACTHDPKHRSCHLSSIDFQVAAAMIEYGLGEYTARISYRFFRLTNYQPRSFRDYQRATR